METMNKKEKRNSYKKMAEMRLGETGINYQGLTMFIVKYVSSKEITVQFKDIIDRTTGRPELANTTYKNFVDGSIKSKFVANVYGVGITGNVGVMEGDKNKNSYMCWMNMLRRCYNESYLSNKAITYKDCKVCDEWLYYPNFERWYNENYYEIKGERVHLDKDILFEGNKVYSPETCVFVPQSINNIFRSYCKPDDKHVTEVAEKYKKIIPNQLYETMIKHTESLAS